MMTEQDYKTYFLRTLVIALSISAVIGIYIFLASDFGDIQVRLLLTTLTMTGYSLTGLCCSVIYKRERLRGLSMVGMVISVLGFLLTIISIWEIVYPDKVWKALIIFIILAFTLAHISLFFLVRPKTDQIKYSMAATLVFIIFVALMLIYLTENEYMDGDFFYRLLGVFAILDVLGTIATPVMNKITSPEQE